MSWRIIRVHKEGRSTVAEYDAAKPLTPDEARELARKLGACADAVDAEKSS